mmetsp:Transcript_29600/g.87743  ORF Transcript_29600/g.87743 Transcript_29600/m.87743 type:complete len:366 (-) Transcript_29600:708-1805(-)
MAYTDLSGSKLKRQLGAALNESVAAPVASFARRQLEKMGWTEGTGLGRNRDGMATHIRVKKREDAMGLGHEKKKVAEAADLWWSNSVGDTLARLSRQNSAVSRDKSKKDKKKAKSKKEKKKRKKEGRVSDGDDVEPRKKKRKKSSKESSSSAGEVKVFTDQELFVATGGARFGMRAQRRSEAKWARTESGSVLWEKEEEAKRKIEWNGLGGAKVVLDNENDGISQTGMSGDKVVVLPAADHGVIQETTQSKISGKDNSRKGRCEGELTWAEVTSNTSSGDNNVAVDSSGSSSEEDVEGQMNKAAGNAEKEQAKSKKKKSSKKDKRRRTNGENDASISSNVKNNGSEDNKKEKKRLKKEKKRKSGK